MKRQRNPFPRASCDRAVERRGVTFVILLFAVIMPGYISVTHAQFCPVGHKLAGSRVFAKARGLAAVEIIIKSLFYQLVKSLFPSAASGP